MYNSHKEENGEPAWVSSPRVLSTYTYIYKLYTYTYTHQESREEGAAGWEVGARGVQRRARLYRSRKHTSDAGERTRSLLSLLFFSLSLALSSWVESVLPTSRTVASRDAYRARLYNSMCWSFFEIMIQSFSILIYRRSTVELISITAVIYYNRRRRERERYNGTEAKSKIER